MGNNILDQFPDLRDRTVDESVYRTTVQGSDLKHSHVENIALAFAISQRRSEQRRGKKRRWFRRTK